jgi:hypothetical protein
MLCLSGSIRDAGPSATSAAGGGSHPFTQGAALGDDAEPMWADRVATPAPLLSPGLSHVAGDPCG